jgi:hypothetical protein
MTLLKLMENAIWERPKFVLFTLFVCHKNSKGVVSYKQRIKTCRLVDKGKGVKIKK